MTHPGEPDTRPGPARGILSRIFGRRTGPTSRPRGWRRWASPWRSLPVAAALAYGLLMFFPGVLFAYRASYRNFEVYSDTPIGPGLSAVLDVAASRLAASGLDDLGMTHRLFLCADPFRRTLLSPRSGGAFGSTSPITGHTILNRADVAADRVMRDASTNNVRPLSAVVAHERTHALLTRRFGVWDSFRMPNWKQEGICEYVAGHPSFPVDEGRRLIREGRDGDSHSFRYVRAYLMVKYLVEVEGLTLDEVAARPLDEAEVLARLRADLAGG